jgi:hypothetical protein
MRKNGDQNPFDHLARIVAKEISSMFNTRVTVNFSDEWKDPSKLISYQRLACCL